MPTPAYASLGYAQTLRHAGLPLDLPEWGTAVILRDIPGAPGKIDAMGPTTPCALLGAAADIPAGLATLRAMGVVSVVLVADPICGPRQAVLSHHFPICRPFKTHHVIDRPRRTGQSRRGIIATGSAAAPGTPRRGWSRCKSLSGRHIGGPSMPDWSRSTRSPASKRSRRPPSRPWRLSRGTNCSPSPPKHRTAKCWPCSYGSGRGDCAYHHLGRNEQNRISGGRDLCGVCRRNRTPG